MANNARKSSRIELNAILNITLFLFHSTKQIHSSHDYLFLLQIPPSLLYTLALMVCIPLFYLANAGSLMYWVIGTGLFLVLAHSAFYASEEVPGQEFEVVTVVTA